MTSETSAPLGDGPIAGLPAAADVNEWITYHAVLESYAAEAVR
jgi:hypothetical protein